MEKELENKQQSVDNVVNSEENLEKNKVGLIADCWREQAQVLIETMEKFPILQYLQARRILREADPDKDKIIDKDNYENEDRIISWLQNKGYLLLTESRHLITKEFYKFITYDTFFDGLNKNALFRVPKEFDFYLKNKKGERVKGGTTSIKEYLKTDQRRRDILKSMWIVADNMPDSKNFIVANLPWTLLYEERVDAIQTVDEEEKVDTTWKVVEVAFFHEGGERALAEIIRNKGKVYKEVRNSIHRIAMIENPDHAFLVPYYGFTEIFTEDKTTPRHLKLVERRSQEIAWKDAE